MPSWLPTKLFGIRLLFADGAPLPERPAIDFVGVTVEDDPTNNRTTITFTESGDIAGATHLATASKLAKRDGSGQCNFAGTCNFESIAASVAVDAPTVTVTSCEADTIVATTSVTSPLFTSASGGAWKSASKTANTTNSGAAAYGSGSVTGSSSSSGAVTLGSGSSTSHSGTVTIASGPSTNGNAGFVSVDGGATSGSGAAAFVRLRGGSSTGSGDGGDIIANAGNSLTGPGGNVLIAPGTGGASVGNVGLGADDPTFGSGERVIHLPECEAAPSTNPDDGIILFVESGVLKARDPAGIITELTPHEQQVDVGALTDNTGGTADTTLQAIPSPTDTPASADALRDDLVANALPAVRNNFADVAAQINAIRDVLRAYGLMS